jgi:hypothetical protein
MEGQNQSIADIDQNKLESTLLTTENNFHWYKTALLILVGASVVAASAMFGIKVGKNQSIISKNVSQNETSLPESQVPTVEIAAVVTPTASLSQNTLLSFNQGKTKVAINLDEKPENVRTSVFEDYLIKTDFDSKYFVRFYKTVDSFKSLPERSVDSDGTSGQGEAVASESVNINGTNFFLN